MKVLVTSASRHGSTAEIARTIADDLRIADIDATYQEIADVTSVDGYDAFVVGSAIYMGNWLREARVFLHKHHDVLVTRPVWLFSSGPLGMDSGHPAMKDETAEELVEAVHAQGHRIFAGKLEHASLSPGERLMVRVVHAPTGDYRNWEEIHRWSNDVQRALGHPSSSALPGNDQLIDAMIRAL